jgi:hypothetical protein
LPVSIKVAKLLPSSATDAQSSPKTATTRGAMRRLI